MLELSKVDQVVDKAAIAALKKARVSRVFSNPTVDSDGHEALSVTIVLKRGRSEQVTGDSALNHFRDIFPAACCVLMITFGIYSPQLAAFL